MRHVDAQSQSTTVCLASEMRGLIAKRTQEEDDGVKTPRSGFS